MGILFAILSSLGWGISAVFVGKGLVNIKVVTGTALSVVSSFLTIAAVTTILQWQDLIAVTWQGIALFAAIGILSFTLGRFFNYLGIERIGAARSTSVTATSPFFASLTAILFLEEAPNLPIISGTLLVIGGLYLTVSGRQDKPAAPLLEPAAGIPRPAGISNLLRISKQILRLQEFWGYVFSLLAAVLWGTNHVLIKLGVTNITTPLVGAMLSTGVGALFLSTVAAKNYGAVARDHKMSLLYIALAGATAAAGLVFQFLAFSVAPVIIVSPLSCTYPIITIVLARIFLRKTEIITARVTAGAFCVVIGSILITLGRP